MNIILVKLLILSNLISYLYIIIQLYITHINIYYILLILRTRRADLTLNPYSSGPSFDPARFYPYQPCIRQQLDLRAGRIDHVSDNNWALHDFTLFNLIDHVACSCSTPLHSLVTRCAAIMTKLLMWDMEIEIMINCLYI
jgi:hypothetical protein